MRRASGELSTCGVSEASGALNILVRIIIHPEFIEVDSGFVTDGVKSGGGRVGRRIYS